MKQAVCEYRAKWRSGRSCTQSPCGGGKFFDYSSKMVLASDALVLPYMIIKLRYVSSQKHRYTSLVQFRQLTTK